MGATGRLDKVRDHIQEAHKQAKEADDYRNPTPILNLISAIDHLAKAIEELARHNEMLEAVTGRMLDEPTDTGDFFDG